MELILSIPRRSELQVEGSIAVPPALASTLWPLIERVWVAMDTVLQAGGFGTDAGRLQIAWASGLDDRDDVRQFRAKVVAMPGCAWRILLGMLAARGVSSISVREARGQSDTEPDLAAWMTDALNAPMAGLLRRRVDEDPIERVDRIVRLEAAAPLDDQQTQETEQLLDSWTELLWGGLPALGSPLGAPPLAEVYLADPYTVKAHVREWHANDEAVDLLDALVTQLHARIPLALASID